MHRQADIADAQTKIADKQADIARGALWIQESSQQQWMSLEHWEVWMDKRRGIFRIRFQVVNPTNLPLALTCVNTVTLIGGVAEACSESNPTSDVLAPNNPSIQDICVSLREDQMEKLLPPPDNEAINVTVGCVIGFSNSTGDDWEQKFERALIFEKRELFDLKEFDSLSPLVRQLSNHLRPKQT